MKMMTTLAAILVFGTALAADAPPVTEWRTLSGDQFREFWRGWKSEGFPAGWHVPYLAQRRSGGPTASTHRLRVGGEKSSR